MEESVWSVVGMGLRVFDTLLMKVVKNVVLVVNATVSSEENVDV
jgi:hypothetical protein